MTDAKILVNSGDGNIKTVHIGEILTIGRNPKNNIALNNDVVSRNHALIRCEGDEYIVLDLGSANGTFLNGQPVTITTKIKNGDEIQIGEIILQFFHESQRQVTPVDTAIHEQTARVFAPVTLAIFVTDIRNYTRLSEQIPAAELSQILADWFDTAGRHIAERGGTIEQFRGDCVAAYWLSNSGDDNNNYIIQAVETARVLVHEVKSVDNNMSRRYPGKSFRIGCGVHVGGAVLGSIGPDARHDLTILGDSVNMTFRIEALCSTLGQEILVSEAIKNTLGETFTFIDLGLHNLKGKSEQLRIYTLE